MRDSITKRYNSKIGSLNPILVGLVLTLIFELVRDNSIILQKAGSWEIPSSSHCTEINARNIVRNKTHSPMTFCCKSSVMLSVTDTFIHIPPFYQGRSFRDSCLFKYTPSPFWKWVYFKRKEFAPDGSTLFPFRVDPVSEGSKKNKFT